MKFKLVYQEVRQKSIEVVCDEDFIDTLVDELHVEFDAEDVVHFGVDVYPLEDK